MIPIGTDDYKAFAVQASVNLFHARYREEAEEMAGVTLLQLMKTGALGMWAEIYKIGKPVVIDWHLEVWEDPVGFQSTKFRLHYRLIVCEFRKMYLPELPPLEFMSYQGKLNWKCPYCGMVNIDEASYCGEKHEHAVGCGVPKGGLAKER